MALEVKSILGELPLFWNRGAVFVTNLHSIFFGNKELTKVLEGEICGMPTYGGRVVSILNLLFQQDHNLIFVESPPDESLLDYISNKLDLSLPEIKILSHSNYATLKESFINKVRGHKAEWLDGFVTDETLITIAEDTGKSTISSFEGSKKGNNKFLLYYHLLEKDLPVFDTVTAFSPVDITLCLEKLRNKGYKKAVLKSQIGASGCGMVQVDITTAHSIEFPEYFFFEGPCLVQGWLDDDVPGVKLYGSPSIQLFLSDDEVSLFDITEQFLNEKSVHEGNISPPPYIKERPEIQEEMLSQASEAGQWLHAQGYRGTAGIDYLVVERDGVLKVIINEINARITGATYPAVLARHFLPYQAWIMRNLKFHKPMHGSRLLSKLDSSDLLFNKNRGKGILPFNFNHDESGNVIKGQFLFLAPEPEECKNLLEEIQTVFQLECKFDRD